MFVVWFKVVNLVFFLNVDIPIETLTGEGVSKYKFYWLVLYVVPLLPCFKYQETFKSKLEKYFTR